MPLNINPISCVTEEGLDLVEIVKGELRQLKVEAYGSGCNAYRDAPPSSEERRPRNMSRRSLEAAIGHIFSQVGVLEFAKESTETRVMIEAGLSKVAERLLPLWFPPDSLIMYSLRVEGRNDAEMSAPYTTKNFNWGYRQKTTPIAVLQLNEWPSAWNKFMFLDRRADTEDITPYMPEGADYLLSTVHKFDRVSERRGDRGGSLNQRYERIKGGESLHWRVKSGPEKLWKMVVLLTGLEEDEPGDVRETIVDDAGIRLLCQANMFGIKFADAHKALTEGRHAWDDLKGNDSIKTLALQKLPAADSSYSHRKAFLSSLPKDYRSFIDELLQEEKREIDLSGRKVLPYYVEMLTRFGTNNNVWFERNVIDTLVYGNDTFGALYEEQGYDQFAYKVRNARWRSEHYTLFEWLIAARLAPLIMTRTSQEYVHRLIGMRMRQAGLLRKSEPFSLLARS
ncbi:hypothetical protein J4470_00580 [Candidatus Woesearchaeota archaeon]|nr:hypothetical protein [Candidatus Woesearchaeota archaeon]